MASGSAELRRRRVIVLGAAAVSAGLAGCGGPGAGEDDEESGEDEEGSDGEGGGDGEEGSDGEGGGEEEEEALAREPR